MNTYEIIVIDDDDKEYLKLKGIDRVERATLMDILFRNGYSILLRLENRDE